MASLSLTAYPNESSKVWANFSALVKLFLTHLVTEHLGATLTVNSAGQS